VSCLPCSSPIYYSSLSIIRARACGREGGKGKRAAERQRHREREREREHTRVSPLAGMQQPSVSWCIMASRAHRASSDPTSAAAPGPAQAASLAGNKEEPSAEDAAGDHGWSIAEFLRDQHSAESLEGIAAEMLAEAREREFPDDFAWCKHLAREESKGSNVVHAILCEGASASLGQGNFMRRAVEFVQKKLAVLLTQESATALEQNEKFCAQADGFMAYGGLEEYFKGLKGWIGPPDDRDPPKTIHDEHCRSAEADEEIYTGNYGVTTTSIKVHARTHTHTHTSTHARTHARMHACTHAHVHGCTHARIFATHTHTHTHECTHARSRFAPARARSDNDDEKGARTHAHTHARARTHVSSSPRAHAHTYSHESTLHWYM